MSNAEIVRRDVQIGEGYAVLAMRRPSIACDPDMVEALEGRGDKIGSHAWSLDHLTRFHGITAEEIERDILEARIPGDALGQRHYDDHNNGACFAAPDSPLPHRRATPTTWKRSKCSGTHSAR